MPLASFRIMSRGGSKGLASRSVKVASTLRGTQAGRLAARQRHPKAPWRALLLAVAGLSLLLPTGPAMALGIHPATGVPICNGGTCGWQFATIPQSVATAQTNLNSIVYVDSQTVVIVGGQGTILRSTDGGVTWNLVSSPSPGVTLNSVVGLPGGVLLAAGSYGDLIASNNGGASWYPYYPHGGLQGNVSEMGFPSLSFGYAATDSGLYFSQDAGETWTAAHLPASPPVQSAGFANSQVGWINAGLNGAIYRTTDGGAHWNEVGLGMTPVSATDIVALSPSEAWILQYQGTVWKTTDGTNYTTMELRTQQKTHQIFVDPPYAWVVSDDANTFYTADSGACWIEESVPQIPELYSVSFYSPQQGVTAGDGVVWYTNNGGLGSNDISQCPANQTTPVSPPTVFILALLAGSTAIVGYWWVRFRGENQGPGETKDSADYKKLQGRLKVRQRKRYIH